MGAITAYRFYYVDSDGQIDGPPTIVECKDDRAAVKTAGQLLLDGRVDTSDDFVPNTELGA
jgi:hypothetical protein